MGNHNIPPLNMKPMFIMAVLTIMFLALASLGNAYPIAVVWGQGGGEDEDTLEHACTSGSPRNYSVVKIAFLTHFGDGNTPIPYLPFHCADSLTCDLTRDIQACQNRGIKVLLSLGWITGDPEAFFPTPQIATDFSNYLWNHFLAGPEHSGPLGSAILDGIDIAIGTGLNDNFVVFVNALAQHRAGRRLYLSATPNCNYPDAFLGDVIDTGLLDYVFVKFYNDESCEYDAENTDPSKLLAAWATWNDGVRAGEVRLQLPAAPEAADSGYVPKEDLADQVISEVKKWPLYGGFMLWNRYYDVKNNYSPAILPEYTAPGPAMALQI